MKWIYQQRSSSIVADKKKEDLSDARFHETNIKNNINIRQILNTKKNNKIYIAPSIQELPITIIA